MTGIFKAAVMISLIAGTMGGLCAGNSMTALVAGETGAMWREHFGRLAACAPIFSKFTEQRHFPYRKTPIELRGEMRFAPGHGLSLRYLEPKERIMIVDSEGVLLRDDRGRSRAAPKDPRRPRVDAVLLPILGFDLDQLLEMFEISTSGDSESWVFTFVPKDAKVAKAIGEIVVAGEGTFIRQIEFRRSSSQRVVITVDESTPNASFTDDEMERFFR